MAFPKTKIPNANHTLSKQRSLMLIMAYAVLVLLKFTRTCLEPYLISTTNFQNTVYCWMNFVKPIMFWLVFLSQNKTTNQKRLSLFSSYPISSNKPLYSQFFIQDRKKTSWYVLNWSTGVWPMMRITVIYMFVLITHVCRNYFHWIIITLLIRHILIK